MAKKMEAGQTQTLKKVLHYMKPYRFFLLLSVILAAITVASTLYLPLLIGKAVDCIVGKGNVNFDGLIAVLIKMAVMIGITSLAQWIMNVCNNKLTYQIVRDIRNEAFEKIEVLPLKYIDGHAHGEIVSRVIADVDQFADGLLMGFTQLFTGVITILGTIGFMHFGQRRHHDCRAGGNTGFPVCGFVYRKTDLQHVQGPVRNERRADRFDR